LAAELGSTPAPGSLQTWLAKVLDDATLRVAYWRDESGTYVDAEGRPIPPSRDDLYETVPITRAGRPVAVVIHRLGGARAADMRDHLGPAARLAIDNERLRAAMLAHVADLQASRARLVESADAARRRLERDLHDGAQQRLLAVMYQLRMARAEDPSDSTALDELAAAALTVAADLRDLAHGIFPAILEEAGLEPALQSLADRARVPTQVTVTGESPPTPIARAVYALVATCIPDEGERPVRIRASRVPGLFVVDIDGTAEVDYTHCRDRITAIGGKIVGHGRRLRVEVPCE
jgi:signal transduction histidine kinase